MATEEKVGPEHQGEAAEAPDRVEAGEATGMRPLVEDLHARREQAKLGGGTEKIAVQHERGKLLARQPSEVGGGMNPIQKGHYRVSSPACKLANLASRRDVSCRTADHRSGTPNDDEPSEARERRGEERRFR